MLGALVVVRKRVPGVVSAVQTSCGLQSLRHGNFLGFQNLTMRSSFGDLAFPCVMEERAGKFPSRLLPDFGRGFSALSCC